jgi:lipid II:glycine glycyltransferase (peptidoglycan interpeptide bridge formation enzyme)
VAALPVMDVQSRLTGRRGVSLPFSDFCLPLGSQQSAFEEVFERARCFGMAANWKWLDLRSGRCFPPATPASASYYQHTVDLRQDEETLFRQFRSSIRTAIRKAVRLGVAVRLSSSMDDVMAFYDLNCRTRRDHGLPPQPVSFFRQIHRHLIAHGMGFVSLATWRGRPVAGNVFLHCGKKALFKFGASDRRAQQVRAGTLAMWEGLRHYVQNGYETLSLGRTHPEHVGLRRYKCSWGAAESMVEYFRYDFRRSAFVHDYNPESGWHNVVFRFLPLRLGRWAGAALYRHMA